MLNPYRETLARAARDAQARPTPFQEQAESALAGFRSVRADLERQVRRGDLTPKVARERAAAAASEFREAIVKRSSGFGATPRVFLDRLVEAAEARKRARESLSIEGLHRETNRLLRLNLVEQQLQARAAEFEGRTFVRPVAGGAPAPTLGGLLGFHRLATESGDEVAREWARRQLEAIRGRVLDPEDVRQVDRATDRPDRINPRLVDAYVESVRGLPDEELERFVEESWREQDANACIAAFLMARQAPGGLGVRWVRKVLVGLGEFPDPALAALRTLEAEARAEEAAAARSQAEYAATLAEAEAALPGVEAPDPRELAREARVQSRPVARPGEAIGLALDRRGALDEHELDGPGL